MSARRKILDLFEEHKAFWESRATEGIEWYRKGDGMENNFTLII